MSLSISLQLEAEGYSNLNNNIIDRKIEKYILYPISDRHITLATIIVDFEDFIPKLKNFTKDKKIRKALNLLIKYPKKLTEKQIDLIADSMENYIHQVTSDFVLTKIKPIVDKQKIINLPYREMAAWPSGHLVARYDFGQSFGKIVKSTYQFLSELFPKGYFKNPPRNFIPHISFAKYDKRYFYHLDDLIQDKTIQDFKLIKGRWIIYPSTRSRD